MTSAVPAPVARGRPRRFRRRGRPLPARRTSGPAGPPPTRGDADAGPSWRHRGPHSGPRGRARRGRPPAPALADQLEERLLDDVLGRVAPLACVQHQRSGVGVDQRAKSVGSFPIKTTRRPSIPPGCPHPSILVGRLGRAKSRSRQEPSGARPSPPRSVLVQYPLKVRARPPRISSRPVTFLAIREGYECGRLLDG